MLRDCPGPAIIINTPFPKITELNFPILQKTRYQIL